MFKESIIKLIKSRIVASIPLLCLVFISLGLKCQKGDYIGKEYLLAPDGFHVTEELTIKHKLDKVNFENDSVQFSAAFSDRVSWTITLRGVQSSAVKRISGTSEAINFTDLFWKGNHDELHFFRAGETVTAQLSFMGSDLISKSQLVINKAKSYSDQGLVLGITPSFAAYGDPGELLSTDIMDPMSPPFKPVYGEFAATMEGEDLNNSYFVSGAKRILTNAEIARFAKYTNPDSVFLNIYIFGYGDEKSKATKMNYAVEEADYGSTHIPDKHDGFEHQMSFDHKGWKLFSIKYSDLTRSANPAYGGNGNNIKEPHKLRAIGFNVISNPPNSKVKATYDFPIITFGKPFNPKQ